MVLEVSSTDQRVVLPGDTARLISPSLPRSSHGRLKCLALALSVYGQHIGTFSVLDEYGRTLYVHQGGLDNLNLVEWGVVTVELLRWQHLFVLEATKGGRYETHDKGDICIDDVSVVLGPCRELILPSKRSL